MEDFLQSIPLWLPGVSIMLLLTGASGFFSGSETAFFSLSRDDLRHFQMGTPKQQYVARLLRKPDRVLTAILFWNLVINLTYFTISVITARQLFIEGYHVAAGFLGVFSLFFMILCGEVLPKSIAVIFRRRISELASVPLGLTILPLDRFLPYLQTIDVAFRRSMFPDIKQEPILNADDLERAVDHSPVSKEMAEKEKQVLHNILDLSEITAEVVMRPRGTYFTITAPVSLNDVRGEKTEGWLHIPDRS